MTQLIEIVRAEVVNESIEKVERESGVSSDTAVALRDQFKTYYGDILKLRENAALVSKPDDPTHQKIAREVRLGLRKVRCEVENTRKALKADSLARGKAIDGFANVLKYLCEPIEEKLLAVEQYAERQEAVRIAAMVEDRARQLESEGADPAAYNLAAMDENTFGLVLEASKKQRAEREEAARKAEAERIEREQAERVAREKAEKEAAEARATAERERTARAEAEAKARKEREAAEKKLKAEREAREKAEREAEEARQREQRRIAQEKAEAEAKARKEREEAERAERAPDKARLIEFAEAVKSMRVPVCKTPKAKPVFVEVQAKVEAFAEWIKKQAETL